MNKIYKKTIQTSFFYPLIILSFFVFTNGLAQTTNKQNPSSSLFASSTSINLEWISPIGKSVMVVASTDNTSPITPEDGRDYTAHSSFGSGTSCGKGFVAYKGTGNSEKITGLTKGTIYYFSIYQYDATGKFTKLISQFFISENPQIENNITEKESTPLKTANATPVVCPALSGITCTLNGTSSSGYLGAPAGCNAGSFAGSNPWDSGSSAGFVSWSFSAPVSKVTLKSGSVNTNDIGTNVLTGGTGGTGSVSGLVCLTSISGMVISYFTSSCCGDVAWTVTTTGSFTTCTLNNTGGQSGWIAECPSAITPAVVLPIELASFTGDCSNSKAVNLKWKTLTETNNSYFTIERSHDLNDWQIVSKIAGAGNSNGPRNYSFTDSDGLSGIMYYRLKQTDFSSIYKYSEVISVDNCGLSSTGDLVIYPNPTISKEIFLKTNSIGSTACIYNSFGEQVASFILNDGENKVDLTSLSNGIYFVKILRDNAQVRSQKIIIQN